MPSINEEMTVQNDDTHSATSELKAAARDVLRVGKQWAHAAQEWFDDRRNEMNNRNRDERDYEAGRARQDRNYESGYHSRQNQTGGAYETRRGYPLHEQANRGRDRSDYDIQSDYSSGGYDPSSPGQDLHAQRSFQGSARDQSDYLERGAYGREDRYAQGRSDSDDYYGQRGYQGSSMQSGQRGMYGERQQQGSDQRPGYSGSQGRDHGDYSSRATQAYQPGSERGQFQGSQRQDYEYPQSYGRGASASSQGRPYGSADYPSQGAQSREYASQGYGGSTGYGSQSGYSQPDYDSRFAGQRMQEYGQGSRTETARSTSGWGPASMGYRGRGPQNYTRSDERIREDLNERLTDADDLDASGINVEVSNGIATLTGSVEERWMKHRAEDLADGCSGVRDVRNQIQVKSTRQAGGSGTSTYAGSTTSSTTATAGDGGSAQSTRAGTTTASQGKTS
jgi:osmotically-inducible protein OsmY